jgi:hypothetical protein
MTLQPNPPVNQGAVNFPKLLRHFRHRTNQVRDLVFERDPIFRKEVMTTKADSSSGRGSGTTSLSGPAVSFGYEESSSAAQSAGTNAAYHINSPGMVIPGLNAVQSPITSRSGKLERTGHRISGECTFYTPALDVIKATGDFTIPQFNELETYDKLIDKERIIYGTQNEGDYSSGGQGTSREFTVGVSNAPGYEIDRVQFQLRTDGGVLDYIQINATLGGSAATLKWDGNATMPNTVNADDLINAQEERFFTTVDLPIRNVSAGDVTPVVIDGTVYDFTAAITGSFDVDKLIGDSNNKINSITIANTGNVRQHTRHIDFYKQAEWRVESIKDFRDELMEIKAVRVRGDRTSRRRAYG